MVVLFGMFRPPEKPHKTRTEAPPESPTRQGPQTRKPQTRTARRKPAPASAHQSPAKQARPFSCADRASFLLVPFPGFLSLPAAIHQCYTVFAISDVFPKNPPVQEVQIFFGSRWFSLVAIIYILYIFLFLYNLKKSALSALNSKKASKYKGFSGAEIFSKLLFFCTKPRKTALRKNRVFTGFGFDPEKSALSALKLSDNLQLVQFLKKDLHWIFALFLRPYCL